MLPDAPGTYALVLRCRSRRRIAVGRAGAMTLRPGWYVYVGSACGPGGLRARVGRHLGRPRRRRWHIDYLRRYARVGAVWWTGRRCEHEWANAAGALDGASIAMPGFGSSDCGCATHLVHFDAAPELAAALRGGRVQG